MGRAVNSLAAQIQSWRQALAIHDFRSVAGLPADSAVILVSSREARALPPGRMLWSPLPPHLAQSPDGAFREAERLEFGGAHVEESRRAYESLAQSPDPAVRAGALVRLARIYRGAGRWEEALAVYNRLAACQGAAVVGMPADLLARRARCNLLRSLGRQAVAESEISSLQHDWLAGRWLLDRPSFLLVDEQLSAWIGASQGPPRAGETISEAAEWLLKRMGNTEDTRSGSRFLTLNGKPVTLVWQTTEDGLAALAAGPALVDGNWRVKAGARLPSYRQLAIANGAAPAALRRSPTETGLPWAAGLAEIGPPSEPAAWAARRRVLWWALTAVVLLVAACGFLLWRIFRREMEVARTILHLGGLLMEDDDLGRDRRLSFYRMQIQAAERLRRSVESLLDFSRMEAGAKPYRMEVQITCCRVLLPTSKLWPKLQGPQDA